MGDRMVEATGYVVVKGKNRRGYPPNPITGLRDVSEVSLSKLTQSRPSKLGVDEVMVRVKIRLPASAFDPLIPDVVITVPEDLIQRGPIVVEAEDATEDSQ